MNIARWFVLGVLLTCITMSIISCGGVHVTTNPVPPAHADNVDLNSLTWEELGDYYLVRSKSTNFSDSASYFSTQASAAYAKAILEEEKRQTELLIKIYYER